MSHFKVTNTTRHPGATKGQHKTGFFVTVIPGKLMGPNRHIIVENVTPGMLAMQRKGYVKIEEVEDISVEVKKQISEGEKARKETLAQAEAVLKADSKKQLDEAKAAALKALDEAKKMEEESIPESSFDKEALKEKVKVDLAQNNAVVTDGSEDDPTADAEDTVFSNGEPNFIVQAGKGKNKKNRR